MRLSSGQLSIILYWSVGALALVVIGNGPSMLGLGVYFLGYVLFRVPYVNDNKSFETFAKAHPYITYGLAGLTALSAVAVFFAAMRNHPPLNESNYDFFVTYYAWIPALCLVTLCVAHEIWLFPRLKGPSAEE